MPGGEKLVTFQGANGNLTKSPYAFKPRGQSGKYVSDLLPNLAELADEMCFIHSMTAKANTHGPAESQMNTGFTLEGFPSIGAWVSYALGTENQDLPAFVAIPDPRGVPQIGPANWSNGFLPGRLPGHGLHRRQADPQPQAAGRRSAPDAERDARDFLKLLNDEHLQAQPRRHRTERPHRLLRTGGADAAERPGGQRPVAGAEGRPRDVRDRRQEPRSTPASRATACWPAGCWRRGVRFVQLFNGAYAMGEGVGNWDGHRQLKADYDRHGPILDQPAAALLKDLKRRGLLDDTLVVWSTEFGRMPTFQQGAQGRDHNPKGFTVWLAGAGVKKAFSYGATDEFGYQAVENVATIYDFHATILHLLGLDHERLTLLPQRHRTPADRRAWAGPQRRAGNLGSVSHPLSARSGFAGRNQVAEGGDGGGGRRRRRRPSYACPVPSRRL